MARLVGYTMKLQGNPDVYWTADGDYTAEYKPVLDVRTVRKFWLEYANSGAFFQIPTLTPVYNYRRRV